MVDGKALTDDKPIGGAPILRQGALKEREGSAAKVVGSEKRLRNTTVALAPVKRFRKGLPSLPNEVIQLVLNQLDVKAMLNAQFVCRMWREAVENCPGYWKERCMALGILPAEVEDTVLGRSARRLRVNINKAQSGSGTPSIVARLYKGHYSFWCSRMCRHCVNDGFSSMNSCCYKPSEIEWIDLDSETDRVIDAMKAWDIIHLPFEGVFFFPSEISENRDDFRLVDEAGQIDYEDVQLNDLVKDPNSEQMCPRTDVFVSTDDVDDYIEYICDKVRKQASIGIPPEKYNLW